jgi:adenylyl-sulfate kinase
MSNIVWHQHSVDQADRAKLKGQNPVLLWFTGLSGAGKSTLAGALERALFEAGFHTYLLDGDNVRHGLCKDLGFSVADRDENLRRVGEVAKLMVDAGLVVLSAFISPTRRSAIAYVHVFLKGNLSKCMSRRRLAYVSSAILKACMLKLAAVKSAILLAFHHPMRPRSPLS